MAYSVIAKYALTLSITNMPNAPKYSVQGSCLIRGYILRLNKWSHEQASLCHRSSLKRGRKQEPKQGTQVPTTSTGFHVRFQIVTGFTEDIIKAAIAARQVIIWLPKAAARCTTEA